MRSPLMPEIMLVTPKKNGKTQLLGAVAISHLLTLSEAEVRSQ